MLLVVGEALVIRTLGEPDVHPSGAPAIAAWVAAQLGTPTAFVGAIGDDADGRLLVGRLGAAGRFAVRPDRPTATAVVEYRPDGSRRFDFAVVGSAATALTIDDLHDLPERASWVHVSGSAIMFGGTLADAAEAAIRRGRAGGAVVSIDPNLRAELSDATLRTRLRALCLDSDVLFPSDDELIRLGLDEDELVAAGAVVCRTMAADGAQVHRDGERVAVPALAAPDDVVDPDGAGDTFAGATIAARMSGAGWPDAVRVASRVVAKAIAVPGPMTVVLTPADADPSAGGQ